MKRRYIAWRTILVVLVLIVEDACAADVVAPQRPQPVRVYERSVERLRFDELLATYGRKKQLPPGYELQALLALSHYPELVDVRINFILDDVGIPISSRPRPLTAIARPMKRQYIVVIDTESDEGRAPLLLKNQPFNAQIGILGHELAHTADYITRGFFGIARAALCQLSDRCRMDFERATDVRTVKHGLGWQRYDHSLFVRTEFARIRGEPYTENTSSTYMGPTELLTIMRESGMYAVGDDS